MATTVINWKVAMYPGLGPAGSLHKPSCHMLSPSKNRPLTYSRDATPTEIATLPKCQKCAKGL